MVLENDKKILQGLAKTVREIADLPTMGERKRLWTNFNKLKPERPMVLCYPEGSWVEIMQTIPLECEDKLMRSWEERLRQQLYWFEHINDDNTIEPYFDISWITHNTGYGVDIAKTHGENRGSYVWEAPIKDLEKDFDKLHIREWTVERNATYDRLELATQIFGDILPPRLRGNPRANFGMTWRLIDFIGLENFMIAMFDEPENIHRLMAFIRDDFYNMLTWHEKEGLLNLHNENDYVGSGGVGYTDELPQKRYKEGGKLTLKDIWGCAEAQETIGVSPDMFNEFILPYQAPILALTGLNCYGCCEPLEERIDELLKLPNMRKFSVSPWCNEEIMAEKLGKNYIFSKKPNPSNVCNWLSDDIIRQDIQKTLKTADGCVLEFILKDTHTVENDPTRLTRWVKMAYEEIGKIN